MPQDPQAEFADKIDLFTWMSAYTGKADDDQIVRATLGRLLFSGDETKKSVKVLSGGEKGRMIYGKLMLTRPNVLLMDEPTNHMDMETIESLQIGLEKYRRHADLRVARPRVRRRPGHAHHRDEAGRHASPTTTAPTTNTCGRRESPPSPGLSPQDSRPQDFRP